MRLAWICEYKDSSTLNPVASGTLNYPELLSLSHDLSVLRTENFLTFIAAQNLVNTFGMPID